MENAAEKKVLSRKILTRIVAARERLIRRYPFYGKLLLRLKIGLARCETAFTDMKYVVFDLDFALRISDKELEFVFLHELMHCVLEHCTRGKGYNQHIYNIACDIVVNSNILAMKGLDTFVVDGQEVMHLTPNGEPGHKFTAEEVYRMLKMHYKSGSGSGGEQLVPGGGGISDLSGMCEGQGNGTNGNAGNVDLDNMKPLDQHLWDKVSQDSYNVHVWHNEVKEVLTSKNYSLINFPPTVRKIAKEYRYKKSIAWKVVLRDFVTRCVKDYDYSFLPPDRRFHDADIFLPGFNPVEELNTDNLWFLIDTSGSINSYELKMAYEELESAIQMVPNLKGVLSFFDTKVTEPKPFDSIKSLNDIKPVGGGGTSFDAIFRYLKKDEKMRAKPPAAIIIFTDGYARFPEQNSAMGIPVLWIIVSTAYYKGDDIKVPWGKCIYIKGGE